jgi:predicted choloylglycine hydrolase
MKIRDSIELLANAPMTQDKIPFEHSDNKVLLTTHITHVAEEANSIKKNNEKIFMSKDYKKFKDGLQSILYHGIVGPSKQTVITTDKDGNKNVVVEKLG